MKQNDKEKQIERLRNYRMLLASLMRQKAKKKEGSA